MSQVLRRWSHSMYAIDELNRFLVMSMNRKMLDEALFCAGQILRAGNGEHLFTKLLVSYCSENVGLGWAQVPIFMSERVKIWKTHVPKSKIPIWENEFILKLVFETVAVLTLIPKNTAVDSLSISLLSSKFSRMPVRPPHDVLDPNKKGFRGIRALLKIKLKEYSDLPALQDRAFLEGISCANVLSLLGTFCNDEIRQVYRDNMWKVLTVKAENDKNNDLLEVIESLYYLFHKKMGIHTRAIWLHANLLIKYYKSANWQPNLEEQVLTDDVKKTIESTVLSWIDQKNGNVSLEVLRPIKIPSWARDGFTIAGQGRHTLAPFQKECKDRGIDISSWSPEEVLKSVNTVEEQKQCIRDLEGMNAIGKYFDSARLIHNANIWYLEPDSKTSDPFYSFAKEKFVERVFCKGWKLCDIRLILNDFWSNSKWSGKAFFEEEWQFPPDHWDPLVAEKAQKLCTRQKRLEETASKKRKIDMIDPDDSNRPTKKIKIDLNSYGIKHKEFKDANFQKTILFCKSKSAKKTIPARDTWWHDKYLWRGPYALDKKVDLDKMERQIKNSATLQQLDLCCPKSVVVFKDEKTAWMRLSVEGLSTVAVNAQKDSQLYDANSCGVLKASKLLPSAWTWKLLRQVIHHLVVRSIHNIGETNLDNLYVNILTDQVWSIIMDEKKSTIVRNKKMKEEKEDKKEKKEKKEVQAPDWVTALFSGNKNKFPSATLQKTILKIIKQNAEEFKKDIQNMQLKLLNSSGVSGPSSTSLTSTTLDKTPSNSSNLFVILNKMCDL